MGPTVPRAAAGRGASTQTTRIVVAVSLVWTVSVFVGELSGHAWQPDTHMAYFAVCALLAAFCDPAALIVATIAVVVMRMARSRVVFWL